MEFEHLRTSLTSLTNTQGTSPADRVVVLAANPGAVVVDREVTRGSINTEKSLSDGGRLLGDRLL